MAQVSATTSVDVARSPADVVAALEDYATVRPKILSAHYRDFAVTSGGVGAGTVARWTLQATSKRSRNVEATISVDHVAAGGGTTITERDANSSLVTTYTVTPSGAGSTVSTTTSWTGAGGIGGFFEKTFAPLGLRKIQAEVLANLASYLR